MANDIEKMMDNINEIDAPLTIGMFVIDKNGKAGTSIGAVCSPQDDVEETIDGALKQILNSNMGNQIKMMQKMLIVCLEEYMEKS